MNPFLLPRVSATGPQNMLPIKIPQKTELDIDATSALDKSQSLPAHMEMKDNKVISYWIT